MKIRNQLLSMIGLIVASFLLSVGIFFLFEANIKTLEQERKILTALETRLYEEAVFVNDLTFRPIVTTLTEYQAVVARTDRAFADLSGVIQLGKRSESIRDALGRISSMNDFMQSRRQNLFSSVDNFLVSGKEVGAFESSTKLTDFSTMKYFAKKPAFETFLDACNSFAGNLLIMNQSCATSIKIIGEQFEIIDGETSRMSFTSIISSVIIVVLLGLSGLALSLVMTKRISVRIGKLENLTRKISDGDLGMAVEIGGKDEITDLGSLMETMRYTLTVSMGGIQTVAAQAQDSKSQLETSVKDSGSALDRLKVEVVRIAGISDNLNHNVTTSDAAVGEIGKDVATVTQMINSQAAMVEESTAAVTQMASSISSLTGIMERNKNGSEKLVRIAEVGETRLKETASIIGRINESIATIQDMANLISSIAARTNLLAMNAAIEAAHAGEFGKGFSVVADEIRTLAEASAENSKTISRNLKNVIGNITGADASSRNSSESFLEVQQEIRRVRDSFDEILNGLRELKEGGIQIMDAMVELNTYTTNITGNTGAINRQSGVMAVSIQAVSESAREVAEASSKVENELEFIRESISTVERHAGAIGEISGQLNAEASRFRVDTYDSDLETL